MPISKDEHYPNAVKLSKDALSQARATHRIVLSYDFQLIYSKLASAEQILMDYAIANGDVSYIKTTLAAKTPELDLGDLSMRKLRVLAARYKVPYYTKLSRDSLIVAINKAKEKEDAEKSRNAGSDPDDQN